MSTDRIIAVGLLVVTGGFLVWMVLNNIDLWWKLLILSVVSYYLGRYLQKLGVK